MRVSRKYKLQGQKVLGVGKSIESTKTKTTTKPKTTTRKSPSQTCVSPAETAKQTAKKQKQQKRGQSPNRTPTKSICHETQWHVHCITLKNVPNELISRLSGKHEGLSLYVNSGMCQAVQESRATFKPLSASSQISSSEGLHDRVVTISVNRNHKNRDGKESKNPPSEGGWTVMAYGKQCRPGKSFQNTIANTQHAPSFIGEDAAIRLIGLSQRSS